MRLSYLFIGIFSFVSLCGQSRWFKHLEGFTARQSFIIGDTIYTLGNKTTDFQTYQRYNLIISKTKLDNEFAGSNTLTNNGFESDSLRGTLMRYYRGSTLHDKNLYIGLSLVGNGKKDKAFLAQYSPKLGIIDTNNFTKDTLTTVIEEVLFMNNQPVIGGFYFYYLSQLTTKLTTFIYYYKNKKIKWIKLYPDESTNIRWRLMNTLSENNENCFYINLQYQTDFAGAPRVWQNYIIKMDTLGNELWRVAPSNRDSINPEGMQMVQKPNGNLLVSWCDYYYRPGKNPQGHPSEPQANRRCTVWFAEIDSTGKVLWRKNIKSYLTQKIGRDSSHNLFHSKAILIKDGVLWTGNYSWQYDHSYLLKTDFNGNPIWYREYELYPTNTAEQSFTPYDVTTTSDGGYVLTGEYVSDKGNIFKNGCQLATIIKVDSFGCLEPGCQKADSVPVGIKTLPKMMCKIYPNPANESVTIELPYYSKGEYTIKIYSSDGRLVEELETSQSKVLNIEAYKSGLYLFELLNKTSHEMETHKISIVR